MIANDQTWEGVRRMKNLFYTVAFAIVLTVSGSACAGEKITIGAVEKVFLMPWGIPLEARIDTREPNTCLDVRDLRVSDNTVEFRLPERYGGLQLRLPLIGWLRSKTTDEEYPQLRPAVEMDLLLGGVKIRAQVALDDHSYMEYPIIVGMRTLRQGGFLIDVDRSNTLSPSRPRE